MFKAIAIGALICAASIPVFAQENLVGKWGGSYEFKGLKGHSTYAVDLEITSVEGSVVKGVAKNFSPGGCRGDHVMTGKLDGNKLAMIADKPGGPASDCKFGFRVTIEGDKMIGTTGPSELKLSKK
jgi:hypothetical protein